MGFVDSLTHTTVTTYCAFWEVLHVTQRLPKWVFPISIQILCFHGLEILKGQTFGWSCQNFHESFYIFLHRSSKLSIPFCICSLCKKSQCPSWSTNSGCNTLKVTELSIHVCFQKKRSLLLFLNHFSNLFHGDMNDKHSMNVFTPVYHGWL